MTSQPKWQPKPQSDLALHKPMATAIRALAMDAVERAGSGHPGLPMGMADVVTVLWRDFLLVDPAHPHWPDRDRFVLSAGHGSMLLYALAYLTGHDSLTVEDLKKFRQLHSKTPGHPERELALGIETTTGPLGQGFGNAVGMALAERMLNARFGEDLVDHWTYVIASDGDLQEGINHESAALAGHLRLARLILLYDDNQVTIDGPASLSMSDDVAARYRSYGWVTRHVDGHDPVAIHAALTWAKTQASGPDGRPALLLCRTTIGHGAPTKGGTSAVHGSPLGATEIAGARQKLEWPHAPFHVPEDILHAWRNLFPDGNSRYRQWHAKMVTLDEEVQRAFTSANIGEIVPAIKDTLRSLQESYREQLPALATRAASGEVLAALLPQYPAIVGGSADLTPSNNTAAPGIKAVTAGDYSGQYIHWGIREHGMAAALNGMALHGGLIPYGGTFLTFSDYCRPAIRLAALMQVRTVFVMTHDSIGLGEDGPTHQPVEHLASLRAIPGLVVIRPADALETLEAWDRALDRHGPTVLALSRQTLPSLPRHAGGLDPDTNQVGRGAYVLREAPEDAAATLTLIATGSEVSLAVEVADMLGRSGVTARVVSMPCMEIFTQQPMSYVESVLQSGTTRMVGIEAGIAMGWERWLGDDGIFFGVADFGISAPALQVYDYFGLTAEKIAAKILAV